MSARRKSPPSRIVHQPAAQIYDRFVESIKKRTRTAQIKAALAANAQLVLHHWEIGRDILASHKREGWGAKVIDGLANDLQREFPKLSGYSASNLKYMRAFAQAWPHREIVPQLAAQIPWGQNCVLLDRLKDAETRAFSLFYHTRLHCYVVIDLKIVDFEPEFAGKMSFYQAAVDNLNQDSARRSDHRNHSLPGKE